MRLLIVFPARISPASLQSAETDTHTQVSQLGNLQVCWGPCDCPATWRGLGAGERQPWGPSSASFEGKVGAV